MFNNAITNDQNYRKVERSQKCENEQHGSEKVLFNKLYVVPLCISMVLTCERRVTSCANIGEHNALHR